MTPRTGKHIEELTEFQRDLSLRRKIKKKLEVSESEFEDLESTTGRILKLNEKQLDDRKTERVRDQLFNRITKSPAKSKALSKIFKGHKKTFQREIFPPLQKKGQIKVYEITSSEKSPLVNDKLNKSRLDKIDYQPKPRKPKEKFRKTFLVNKKNGGLSYTKNDYENYKVAINKLIRHRIAVTPRMVNQAMPTIFHNMRRNMKKNLDIFKKRSTSVDESLDIEERRREISKKFMSRVAEISMMVKSRLRGKELSSKISDHSKRSNSVSFRKDNREGKSSRKRAKSKISNYKRSPLESMNTYNLLEESTESFPNPSVLRTGSEFNFTITGKKLNKKGKNRRSVIKIKDETVENILEERQEKVRTILGEKGEVYNEESKKKWNKAMGNRLGKQRDFHRQFIPIGIENGKRIIIELK